MKTETRNYNQGRVKELIENSLYEADQNFHISFNSPPPYKFKEFDILPENKIFNDSESIFIKYYNTENGEVIAFCSIRERYLKLIQDGELSDRKHEYNLFKKYAEIFLVEKNKNITLRSLTQGRKERSEKLSMSLTLQVTFLLTILKSKDFFNLFSFFYYFIIKFDSFFHSRFLLHYFNSIIMIIFPSIKPRNPPFF